MTRSLLPLALLAALAASTANGADPAKAAKPAATPATAAAPAGKPATPANDKPRSKPMADILKDSKPGEWRPLDPENTLYMELPSGRVVIELAPAFAPLHADNIRKLVRAKYFDGLAIIRAQDNYVVQWGDPEEDEAKAKPIGSAAAKLPPEFTAPYAASEPFVRLPDHDGYAPEVGFSNGFPAARNPKTGQSWLTHCYGAIGVARGTETDSGNGSSLYAIISQAPRQLDRNIAVVGRVVQGIEKLTVMARGTGPLGFYEKPEQRTPITSVRLAADVPAAERSNLEVLRSDSASFAAVVEGRRNRHDDFYVEPAGYIELCNAPLPVRPVATAP
jgi:peptidylprolyl isomerase